MNTKLNKIIDIVDSYISLCLLVVTQDYNNQYKHLFEYRKRWETLMAYETMLDLPIWIKHSPNVTHAHSAIKTKCGTGEGSWGRRNKFLDETRNQIIDSYEKNCASKNKSSSAINLADYNPKPLASLDQTRSTLTDKEKATTSMNQGIPSKRIVETIAEVVKNPQDNFKTQGTPMKKKVFIVHGHDEKLKYEVYQFLIEEDFEPVILHLQANDGDTIIQKLERYFKDISYAIVLYTACDEGRSVKETDYRPRARQNVVFEHGYLISKLGREYVTALVSDGVETPGDMSGVVYIQESADWRYSLLRELKKLKQ
ncbi:nucleotide-binding protein [Pseudescherichia sp.]|uniref:nucleotide-binding protein n=1 Tax=Pseudescherichia sp. TaxID=2055881 RepID=UPI002898D286|nr:nucleotide-binding protein [Pseudescherichia sp.]